MAIFFQALGGTIPIAFIAYLLGRYVFDQMNKPVQIVGTTAIAMLVSIAIAGFTYADTGEVWTLAAAPVYVWSALIVLFARFFIYWFTKPEGTGVQQSYVSAAQNVAPGTDTRFEGTETSTAQRGFATESQVPLSETNATPQSQKASVEKYSVGWEIFYRLVILVVGTVAGGSFLGFIGVVILGRRGTEDIGVAFLGMLAGMAIASGIYWAIALPVKKRLG